MDPIKRQETREPALLVPGGEYGSFPVVEASAGPSASLRDYGYALWRRQWVILTSVLVAGTLAVILAFKMTPVYQATVRLEIEAEVPQLRPLNDYYQGGGPDETYLKTQIRVLQSDNLAWRTIQQLGLSSREEFSPGSAGGSKPAPNPRLEQDLLIRAFKRHLDVELARNSRMVEVSLESTDPDLAARVANTLVDNYMEYFFHEKYDATRLASGWMEQQLDELKAKVEKSQQALIDYERQNAIVNIGDKQSVAAQRLADLSRELTNAESDRLQKESLYDLVRSNESQVALVAQNQLLERLEEKNADVRTQYVDALSQFGPNFPKVTRLREQVNEIESLLARERVRIVARMRSDYQAACGRERLAAGSVAREKGEVERLNQSQIQQNMLKHDFETNQQLYESLLQRLKDAAVSAGLRATNIHVVDPALPPAVPLRPKKLLYVGAGLLVGLLVGIVIAFAQEGLDRSIKSAEDVENLLGSPSLAIIPQAGTGRNALSRQDRKGAGNGRAAFAALKEPDSPLAESYRALCTSILLSTAPRPPQAILVTSAQPNEGKSCTSLNLAVALAQRGSRVLVVDADLRKPGIAGALGLENEKGLSGVLTGGVGLEEALHPVAPVPGLWVLPSGPRPPNPAELVSSPTMERILSELRERFDYLIVDSPPLLLVTDPTILSSLVDGAILVVESGVTAGGALARAHRILKSAGGRILGVVLNKMNFRESNYYYGSYYYDDYGRTSTNPGLEELVWTSKRSS